MSLWTIMLWQNLVLDCWSLSFDPRLSGTLNRIQHEERETWGKTRLLLHVPQTSLIPRPSHHPFLFASSFYVLKAVKNCMMGRLDLRTTLLQIRPVLTSYLLLWPNSTIDSLCQIVILQLHRHEACSAATYRLHTTCAHQNRFEASFKPPPGSGLRSSLRTGS